MSSTVSRLLALCLILSMCTPALTQRAGYQAKVTLTGMGDAETVTQFQLPIMSPTEKINFGRTESVDLYYMKVEDNCSVLPVSTEEMYYAAYIQIPEKCSPMDLLATLQNDGADFLFVESDSDDFKINRKGLYVPTLNVKKSNARYFVQAVQNAVKLIDDKAEPKDGTKPTRNRYIKPLMKVFITFPHRSVKEKYTSVDFLYSPANVRSFDYINTFATVFSELKDYLKFEPFVAVYKLSTSAGSKKNKNCYHRTPYCAADPDSTGPATGENVIEESLREKCVFKQSKDAWFKYMIAYGNSCSNIFTETCSLSCMSSAGVDSAQVTRCIAESKLDEHDNLMLKTDYNKLKELQDMNYPALYINGDLYHVDPVLPRDISTRR